MDKLLKVITSISSLNDEQLLLLEKYITTLKMPPTPVISCPAPSPSVKKYALVRRTRDTVRVLVVGTREECLKNVKRNEYTSVGADMWVYGCVTVSIVEVEDEEIDVVSHNGPSNPTHVVILLKDHIPDRMMLFNNQEAVDRYTSILSANTYKVVSL